MIFVSIPALLILKCLDDDDKGICRSFFPPMFGEDGPKSTSDDETEPFVDKVATHNKFLDLKREYQSCKGKSKNEYDFFNLVERSIIGMEDDETLEKKAVSDKEFEDNGLSRTEMQKIVQKVRVLSMQM